jgi:RNA polymerase sigma-70 factor (ECF subfamily)
LLREEDTPETLYEQKELRELVHTVIGQMSENLREILLLAYFKQLQYKEIAEVVGVPLGTVKSRLHAAVKLFSKLYMETTSNDRDDSEAPGDLGASGAV